MPATVSRPEPHSETSEPRHAVSTARHARGTQRENSPVAPQVEASRADARGGDTESNLILEPEAFAPPNTETPAETGEPVHGPVLEPAPTATLSPSHSHLPAGAPEETPPHAPAAVQQRPQRSPWHFAAVDGLRGLAIASVLLYHSNWSPRGLFGVDVFFVVSGFLITLLLLRELGKTGKIGLRNFYTRRVKRLIPGLLITLGVVLLISWRFESAKELQANATKSLFSLLQIANWQQLHSGEAYWDITGKIQPLAHMWSLSITEQFYIVWPFVVLVLWWLTRKSPLAMTVAFAVLLAGSSLVAPLLWDGSNSDRLYLGTDTRAVAFVAGAALASLVYWSLNRRISRGAEPRVSPLRQFLFTGLSVLSLGVVVTASVLTASYHEPWLYQGGLSVVAVTAAIFTATLCSANNRLVPFFAFSLFTSFGKLSYTVYLLHLPVYWVLQMLTPGIRPLVLFAVGGILTWLLSAFVHYAITERMRLAPWRITRGIPALIASVALVAGMSVVLPEVRTAAMQSTEMRETGDSAVALEPGIAGGRPVVLTLGDSLANDFATALADHGSGGVAVVDGGVGGCGIMTDEKVRASSGYVWDDLSHCNFWRTTWPNQMAEHQPDFVLLHSTWDAADQYVDGTWLRPGDPEYTERYLGLLDEVAEWAATNAPHAKILISNDRLTNGIVTSPTQMAAFNDLVQSFAHAHANVRLLDLYGGLCPEEECFATTSAGANLYLDDNVHFSPGGLDVLATLLEHDIAAAQQDH